MLIEIDKSSGFCFGVIYAIQKAEEYLKQDGKLFCLGDIVHNNVEVERLEELGLITITHEQFKTIKNCRVLIRAHGEPPETYRIAMQNNIQLIDASCPVVLRLQNKIKIGFDEVHQLGGQLLIFGKEGHAEVNGLVGQTAGKALVIGNLSDLDKVDFSKSIFLFSQTTKSIDEFQNLVKEIKKRINGKNEFVVFQHFDTICRQVANRDKIIKTFAKQYELVLFVSGKKSSNGKVLFESCKEVNPNTKFISDDSEIEIPWLKNISTIGICGATSTPFWLMEKVKSQLQNLCKS